MQMCLNTGYAHLLAIPPNEWNWWVGPCLFFIFRPSCACCFSYMHSFINIRKEIVSKIGESAMQMDHNHHFLPKFNSKAQYVPKWGREREGLGCVQRLQGETAGHTLKAGRGTDARAPGSPCLNVKTPGQVSPNSSHRILGEGIQLWLTEGSGSRECGHQGQIMWHSVREQPAGGKPRKTEAGLGASQRFFY